MNSFIKIHIWNLLKPLHVKVRHCYSNHWLVPLINCCGLLDHLIGGFVVFMLHKILGGWRHQKKKWSLAPVQTWSEWPTRSGDKMVSNTKLGPQIPKQGLRSRLTSEALCCHPAEIRGVQSRRLCRSSSHLAASYGCTSIFCTSPAKRNRGANIVQQTPKLTLMRLYLVDAGEKMSTQCGRNAHRQRCGSSNLDPRVDSVVI